MEGSVSHGLESGPGDLLGRLTRGTKVRTGWIKRCVRQFH